jgi:hypothetical protein
MHTRLSNAAFLRRLRGGVCLGLLLTAAGASAADSGEIVAANVVSRGFDVLLRVQPTPANLRLDLFQDAAGVLPAGDLTVERQALPNGSTADDAYIARCADRDARAAMTAAGNLLFRVSNAAPDSDYFCRLVGDGAQWPASGLLRVHTLPTGAWRASAHQLMVDVGRPGDGWLASLTAPGAASPLLAVCGDGVPTNSCFLFNLADLADTNGAPFAPGSGDSLALRLYGKAGVPVSQRALMYVPPPSAEAAVAAFSAETAPLLRLLIASALNAVCEPPPGENFLFGGGDNVVTCRLTQAVVTQVATQFTAYGWTGTGSVPANGRATSFSFALTADSSLAWNWRTNYWIEILAEHGAVDPPGGWFRAGATLNPRATPDAEWLFSHWSGLAVGADPAIALVVDRPGSLQANFTPVLVAGGDGMPAWWLTQHGLAGLDRDPNADPDHDGISNKHEWIADTSPTNADSALRITGLARAGGVAQLAWRGGREARQIVEVLEGNLATGQWRPLTTNLPPTDIVGACAIQMAGHPTLFFRIRAER